MTFSNIKQIEKYIRTTHTSFAGKDPGSALDVLIEMKANMDFYPAMMGAIFEAETDPDHGSLSTVVEISRVGGEWEYKERIA